MQNLEADKVVLNAEIAKRDDLLFELKEEYNKELTIQTKKTKKLEKIHQTKLEQQKLLYED